MTSKTFTKVFHLELEGPDSDYGPVYCAQAKVTIEQSWDFDEEQIHDIKTMLADYYGCSLHRVMTDEDRAKESVEIDKYIDDYNKQNQQTNDQQ
jgi:hypothetical protein